MRRVSIIVPQSFLRNLYYALVFSRLTYAISTWGSAYPTSLWRLESLVKKAIMLVTNYMDRNHIPITVERSLLQYDDVYRYFISAKTYDMIRKGKQKYFTDKFNRLLIPHRYETRSNLERRFNQSMWYPNVKTHSYSEAYEYGTKSLMPLNPHVPLEGSEGNSRDTTKIDLGIPAC